MQNTTKRLTSEDQAAIRDFVTDVEYGFNSNDPALLARRITPDAQIVNPMGTVMHGPSAVEASAPDLLVNGPLQNATAQEADNGAPPQIA